ncbi:hypothetical protein [Haloarchaeobius amylolyticus]|uniref:hypothetical protein n=1 Tax=Haloarchaeobius amylolyticus TaxID=1198296 RepID=UPI002271976B|nr:hypothetical protein [Haloarchaeobius amylolyticus]
MQRQTVLLAVLGLHLAVALGHGATHGLVPVPLPPWQNALVLATVFVGPVVGAALAVRNHPLGLPVFTASMACALVLGVSLHFVVEGPDHVHAIPAGQWRLAFQVSAVGVAVTPLLGTLVGAWALFTR